LRREIAHQRASWPGGDQQRHKRDHQHERRSDPAAGWRVVRLAFAEAEGIDRRGPSAQLAIRLIDFRGTPRVAARAIG
jgi:hypothetical protein